MTKLMAFFVVSWYLLCKSLRIISHVNVFLTEKNLYVAFYGNCLRNMNKINKKKIVISRMPKMCELEGVK